MKQPVFCNLVTTLLILAQGIAQSSTPQSPSTPSGSQARQQEKIPFAEIGARAQESCQGDAIGIHPCSMGARLRCGFQKLDADATPSGLWLESMEGSGDRFRLVATSLGRADSIHIDLATEGLVSATDKLVTFTRPWLNEEYSVSMDGVRQNFVIPGRPQGDSRLEVAVSISGATAAQSQHGVELTLSESGRRMTYSRLKVTDSTGMVLPATMAVTSPNTITMSVDDENAAYPVTIDPTISDSDWVALNSSNGGVDSDVYAMAADGQGNIYLGGDFTRVGRLYGAEHGLVANHVVKWNGSSWFPLGTGVNGDVYALKCVNNELYVGGDFTMAGGQSALNIAKWSGSSWSPLGSGCGEVVRAIEYSANSNTLYVGGEFTTVGNGIQASYLARWTAGAWSAMPGGGTSGEVLSLVLKSTTDELYVGGDFQSVGSGVSAKCIAKWSSGSWSSLGSGTSAQVLSLALNPTTGELYAGGDFLSAGGASVNRIAKWNGTSWSGFGLGASDTVRAIAVLNGGVLYIGGDFQTAGGVSSAGMAKWNGTGWAGTSEFFSNAIATIHAVVALDSGVYFGGESFGAPPRPFMKWDGSWSLPGYGTNEGISCFAVSGSDLYVGGSFYVIGGIYASGIAKWDGSSWSGLGSGVSNNTQATWDLPNVSSIAVHAGSVYAGGYFDKAGGVPVNHVAKWNGTSWSALGGGTNAEVRALAANNGILYVGGIFGPGGSNGPPSGRIARWNIGAGTWSSMGGAEGQFSGWPGIYALTCDGETVYAGGGFTTIGADSLSATHIAKWNEATDTWSAMGGGMNGFVNALLFTNGTLFAGGDFTIAGGNISNRIAKWNGTSWSPVGTGTNGSVHALAMSGGSLFAGGDFTQAGDLPASNIAQWDGTT